MNLIQYIESVELVADSASKQRFYFGDRPSLRDKIVIHCHVNPTDLSHSFNNRTDINSLARAKAFLVLVSKDDEVINHYPTEYLSRDQHMPRPLEINRIIDWEKSYVEFSETTDIAAGQAFIFTFYCAEKNIRPAPRGMGLNIEAVEVKTTPATLLRYYFPDNEKLKGKRIHHIESAWYDVLKTPSNYTRVTTVPVLSYLTLVTEGKEKIRRLPLENLNVNGYQGWMPTLDLIPDLPKSYIEIPRTDYTVEDEAYLLFFYYWDKTIQR